MNKIKLLLLFILLTPLIGCNLNISRYAHFKESPYNNYYSLELKEKLLNNEDYSLEVFDGNLYKYFKVDKEDLNIIIDFLNSLNSENYLDEEINKKPLYKLILTFEDSKYIFKIYNENLVTLSPWDGNLKEDIIDMSKVPLHFNLYDFCKYVQHKK